jgi:hypothetical protein
MKKIFSISLSLLMLMAMLHFSVATHYCHGNIAASKISLSGKPASCGMENGQKDLPLSGTHFSSLCCDDAMVYPGISSNYAPSFSDKIESYQNSFQILSIPVGLPVLHQLVLQPIYTSVSPPGVLMSTNVDLSDICVFRI